MSPHARAELTHLNALKRSHPGTLTLGTRTIPCALLPERGAKWDGNGGQIQQRQITILCACTDLPASDIINTTTDATRAIRFTHRETGRIYTLSTDADTPEPSPHGIYWTLHGTQPTVT